jgi:GNAT superfamily N-acetyltransferase
MKLTAPVDIREAVNRVKAAAAAFGTNLFSSDQALADAIGRGGISAAEFEGAALFRLREADFERVYFAAASPDALSDALRRSPVIPGGVVVSDVVGRPADAAPWVEAFRVAGFTRYNGFIRMQRVVQAGRAAPGNMARARAISRMLNPKLRDAALLPIDRLLPEDAPLVQQAIASQFDAYAEHIPGVEEVRQAAEAGSILIVRDGGQLAALLYYDRTGLTTTCRYWLAMPAFRGCGYAEMLMERYFEETTSCPRSLLWVQEKNRAAIPLYEAYGYKADGLAYAILIHRH